MPSVIRDPASHGAGRSSRLSTTRNRASFRDTVVSPQSGSNTRSNQPPLSLPNTTRNFLKGCEVSRSVLGRKYTGVLTLPMFALRQSVRYDHATQYLSLLEYELKTPKIIRLLRFRFFKGLKRRTYPTQHILRSFICSIAVLHVLSVSVGSFQRRSTSVLDFHFGPGRRSKLTWS